eukprot:GEMP01017495.1.p1 GENE.GEMP01017495.1~~GEMP01017495.1.p1  ORF type:complete len:659 (+),score=242.70 GEMP01017495.1:111-2087(+)
MRAIFIGLLGTLVLSDDKARPVTKVINLLKQMQDELANEVKKDQEVYDQIACWCKTNEKEKTQSIKTANAQIEQLTSNIEEFTATTSRLKTEIKQLEKDVDSNQKSLDKATALRRKELAVFNSEEKDMLESIRAMKSAITVLSKHNQALIQADTWQNIQTLVKAQLEKPTASEAITPSQKKMLNIFVQAPAGFKSYSGQSGQIFGILNSMSDTFQANLASSQREELQNQQQYEQMKQAKEEEIQAATEQLNKKKELLADAKEANAEAKQNLEDTRASLAADTEFLKNVRDKCAQTDAEFETRSKNRQEEIAGVNKALVILSSDDVHDNVGKTFNAPESFVQVSDSRTQASALVKTAAKKYDNPKLATLATAIRLDAFTKVKVAIDQMIAELTKEKADEIKHKDWCNEQQHQNTKQTEARQRDFEEHTASVEGLDSDIKTLGAQIDTLKAEVKELNKQVVRAGENRAKENKEFQETVTEQRETKHVLQNAIQVLAAVFEKKEKARFALVQKQQPPAQFDAYKKNENSGGVLGMLREIIADATKMEAEAIRDEEDAQVSYESFVKETNNSVTAKSKSIVNKQAVKAEKQGERTEEQRGVQEAQSDIKQLGEEAAAVHQSCDFTLKNFDVRQDAREQEVEALRQAKAILGGSNFGAFLQRW